MVAEYQWMGQTYAFVNPPRSVRSGTLTNLMVLVYDMKSVSELKRDILYGHMGLFLPENIQMHEYLSLSS